MNKSKMQQSGGLLLPPVQKLVATIILAEGKNANQIPPSLQKEFILILVHAGKGNISPIYH